MHFNEVYNKVFWRKQMNWIMLRKKALDLLQRSCHFCIVLTAASDLPIFVSFFWRMKSSVGAFFVELAERGELCTVVVVVHYITYVTSGREKSGNSVRFISDLWKKKTLFQRNIYLIIYFLFQLYCYYSPNLLFGSLQNTSATARLIYTGWSTSENEDFVIVHWANK